MCVLYQRVAMSQIEMIAAIKQRSWFYEFELPDGSKTSSHLPPEIAPLHTSRREKLRRVITDRVPNADTCTALDLSSHEGYFSLELAVHFASVCGLEFRESSIEAARLITAALGVQNVTYRQTDLQKMEFDSSLCAEFVLMYGLLYRVENPIHLLRLAASLTRRHILIETQVFPYDLSGRIEDGSHNSQRQVAGVFSLSPDYPGLHTGGSTELALVPSLNAVVYLLRHFGFVEVEVLPSAPGDYEQFRRGSRVVVYGKK
jgi:tRNA (mo5U34)-methyltransferase